MLEAIIDNTYLIILLPLWIFLIIMIGRFFSVYVNKKITYILTLLSSFLGIVFTGLNLKNFTTPIIHNFDFIKINDFSIPLGIHIDKLSLILGLLLFIISFLVQIFSINYEKDDKKSYKFFALLNFFNFAMSGLIFSANLFDLYIFWELVGLTSYLLIGFDYKKEIKSKASQSVFLINRFGDTALISGIILISYFMYNYANPNFSALAFEDMSAISTMLYAYTSSWSFYIISILLIIGCAVKSAQFPFHTWLQDAMEAKLPVSALLHSATMVVAGVFLLIRLLPIISMQQQLLNITIVLGIITTLICSIFASLETHSKKVLAYSTSANLGLMFVAVGFCNIKIAVTILIAHAFIKAMLFLLLPNEDDKNITYANYITFLLGALSLAGILFSGFIGKEGLYFVISNNIILTVLYLISSVFTAYYIIRLGLLLIKDRSLVKSFNFINFMPVGLLMLLNILFYLFVRNKMSYSLAEPFWCAILGWFMAFFLYKKDKLEKFGNKLDIMTNVYHKFIPTKYNSLTKACDCIDKNVFENYKPLIFVSKTLIKITGLIEKYVMNGYVNLVTYCSKKISQFDSIRQTRNVQTYNAYGFIILTLVLTLIIIAYTIILSEF